MNLSRQILQRFAFLLLVALFSALSGCASYYSHYGAFPAENSAGEERQVTLSWQTAEYPGWWVQDNQSTPINVVTQCSTRAWRLTDNSHSDRGSCGAGDDGREGEDRIRACGEPGQDLIARAGKPATERDVCMSIDPGQGRSKVVDIGQSLALTVSCSPARTTRPVADEEENIDYLRASTVPYKVYVRKAPRGALNGRPPAMDESVCDEE